jgi:hypothetical protein
MKDWNRVENLLRPGATHQPVSEWQGALHAVQLKRLKR